MADRAHALRVLCDTFVPGDGGLPPASALGVPELLRREVEALGRPQYVAELDQLLDALESPLLNTVLGGRPDRFSALPLAARESFLKRWAESPVPLKRRAFQVMKRLVFLYTYAIEGSPYSATLGYAPPALDDAAAPSLRARTPRAGEELEADVCVIGSGAGGGVVAAELAAAGKRVVVLERATPRLEAEFDGRELEGYRSLFFDRANAATADRAISLLAGTALGGGTVVNWSNCLRIGAAVAEEWRAAGIDGLDEHYDDVAGTIDVGTDESAHNGTNRVLDRGLRVLGAERSTIARNVRGCGDCGHCTFGCRRGAKQSTLRTYLARAFERGAEILGAADARRIELRDGRASAVVVRVPGGEMRVRARAVALAGGAILSPAVLLRSGIAADQAGRHFHLHPAALTTGVYAEDLGLPWSGVPQSAMSSAFAEIDGAYGFRIEAVAMYPGIVAAAVPWWGFQAHRARLAEVGHIAPFVGLVRDRTEGRVVIDDVGEPVVRYALGALERSLLARAMIESARIHAAAGARRIDTLHTPPLQRDTGRLDELIAEIRRRGVVPNRVTLFSAHQMSSCRIGSDRASSVADPDGQVWDARGLYVTDASAFPSASGVNPMLTVMALARRTAQRMRAAL